MKRPWRSPGSFQLAGAAGACFFCLISCDSRDIPLNPQAEVTQAAPAPEIRELFEFSTGQRELAPGERHSYTLALSQGSFVELVVEQRGIDVVTTLHAPGAEDALAVVDRPINAFGPEPLLAIAAEAGTYRLEIRAFEDDVPAGEYGVRVVTLRPATDIDRQRATAAEHFAAGEANRRSANYAASAADHRTALERWQGTGDLFWQGETLNRLGTIEARQGNWKAAIDLYRQSAEIFRRAGDNHSLSIALAHIGTLLHEHGDVSESVEFAREALELRKTTGDHQGTLTLVLSLAQANQVLGRIEQALDYYNDAIVRLDRHPNPSEKGRADHNLGRLFYRMGQPARALDHFERAEQVWRQLADLNRRAATSNQMGRVYLELGQVEEAIARFSLALELRIAAGNLRGQAAALVSLGDAQLFQGDAPLAVEHYSQALDLLSGLDNPRSSARAQAALGAALLELGEHEKARAHYAHAVELSTTTGDPEGEARALFGLAQSLRSLGDLDAALGTIESAIEKLERVRPKAYSDDLSPSFFATVDPYFEAQVATLMELHAREPDEGHARRALAASESGRARALIDLLEESGAQVRDDSAPRLIDEERRLQARLNELERSRWRRRAASQSSLEDPLAAKVREVLEDLGKVRAEIRNSSPRYAALTQPNTLSAGDIQRQLLDADTLLLEYMIGPESSTLWVVGSDSFAAYPLPGRDELEDSARRAYRLLTLSHRREAAAALTGRLCELSNKLLAPAAEHLQNKRLVIVADEMLLYLPWAALPDPRSPAPCSEAPPLVVANEITYLPSASALAVLRRETRDRPPSKGALAILADPVFSAEDSRLHSSEQASGSIHSGHETTRRVPTAGGFRRLKFSLLEAETVLSMFPADETFQALGFEANKQTVLSGKLSDHRIVHMATHGVLNTSEPSLSSLVLSMVDPQGESIDGFLRGHELFNLDLPAELIVLSACQTALGKEVRGEGLIGMTRGLMYAGAERVMLTLWSVDDESTAELMALFYRSLIEEGNTPAAALRAAQLAILQERPEPYYWAGFMTQGKFK